MAEPSFFAEGSQPRRTDTRLRVLKKILGATQNSGGLAANNPRRTDTLRITKQKWLNALDGLPFNG